jgi:hypothetical protein
MDLSGNHIDMSRNRHNDIRMDVSGNYIHINYIYESGWERERFVSSNEDYICGICLNVYRNAMTLQCGHTFCYDCSRQINRCAICRALASDFVPDYAKRMHILGLTVHCNHKGCPVTDSLRTIQHHEQVCDYKVVACNDCKTDVCRKDYQDHKLVCTERKVSCAVCLKMYPYRTLSDHLCPQAHIACELCEWTGKRVEQERHDKECMNRVIACPLARYGCTFTGVRHGMLAHIETMDHVVMMSQSIEERLARIGLGL